MIAARWHRYAPLLVAASGMGLAFVACGPSDHGSRLGGDFETGPSGTPGGPCTDGTTRQCGIELGAHDGVIDCAPGTTTCVGGAWGACVPLGGKSYSVNAPPPITPESAGASTLGTKTIAYTADGGASTGCTDDPCNPYCNGFTDTPPSDAGYSTEAGSISTFVTGTFVLLSELPGGSIPSGFLAKGSNPTDCANSDINVRNRACQFDQHCQSGATCTTTDPFVYNTATVGGVTYCCRSWEAGQSGPPSGCTGADVTTPPACTPYVSPGVLSTTVLSVDICNRGTTPLTEDVKCYSLSPSIFPPSDYPPLSGLAMDSSKATSAPASAGKPQGTPISVRPILPGECSQFLTWDGDFSSTGNAALICNPYTLAAATTTDFYPTTTTSASMALGAYHGCVILANGSVKCWGDNGDGQVGDGTYTNRTTPVAITLPTTALQVAMGWYNTCALLSDGTVKCWGYNGWGQLGDGTTTERTSPVSVAGLASVTQIAANSTHTCARISDGTVKCWGGNSSGELGDGTTTSRTGPTAVPGLTNVVQLTAGYDHTCARISDGTIKCWGSNWNGQLGNGTTTSSTSPVAVSGITTAASVQAGAYSTCARLTDGTVKCWGYNADGEIGDGTTTQRNTPTAVSGISTAVNLTNGYYHACARLADNTVKCWGYNSYGQLGTGTTTNATTPTAMLASAGTTLANVGAVAAGFDFSCALISGTLKCTGSNTLGELGNGGTTSSSYPTASALGSIDNWNNPKNALSASDANASAMALLSTTGTNRITFGDFNVVVPSRVDPSMLFAASASWKVAAPSTNNVFLLNTSLDGAATFAHVTTVDPSPTAFTTAAETPYAVTAAQVSNTNLKVAVDAKLKAAGSMTASLDWAKVSLTTQAITSLPECDISNNWTVTKVNPPIPCGSRPIKTTTYSAEPFTVTRVFNAVCPTGTSVAWRKFGYTSSTPTGTSIDFHFHAVAPVKNTTTGAMECPAATPETTSTPFITAVASPTDTQNCSISSTTTSWGCPVDLNTKLGTKASLACLEMDAAGNTSVTLTSAASPTLYTWNASYDCIPSE